MTAREDLFGLMAEFDDPDRLLEAVRRAREAGFRRFDAHTPFPVEGLVAAMGIHEPMTTRVAILGGVVGASAGLALQWWINVVDYPLNIGGRPLADWPSFALPAFEMAVLFAVIGAVLTMLVRSRLPRLSHPLFAVDRFHLSSASAFFLVIEAADPRFDPDRTMDFLRTLEPVSLREVPA